MLRAISAITPAHAEQARKWASDSSSRRSLDGAPRPPHPARKRAMISSSPRHAPPLAIAGTIIRFESERQVSRTPVDENVSSAYARGRSAWPAVRIALETFAERLADLNVPTSGLEAWGTDLYLACAAGEGDHAAIRAIDQLFVARLVGRIRRLGASTDDTADVLQMVRERLFAGPHPRIRAYNAVGPLEQWVKVIAIRTAVDRHRVESRARPSGELADSAAAPAPALEEVLFKIRYKAEFEQALRDQIRALSERDRTVLRLHLYDHLSLEDIAAARGVHRVTVARWIWNAGEIVLEGLRRHFKEHYGMVPSECDSLARLVQSQLALGLRSLLQNADG